ncbi:MAG: phosphomannomutase/phosphoglucomutase [Candidatus Norongarragalinales archaeon]
MKQFYAFLRKDAFSLTAGVVVEGIFGGYDVRGVYGENFDEKRALDLGKAFGTFMLKETAAGKTRNPRLACGRDNRLSSPSLFKAFVGGLRSTGCTVFEVGVVPSPVAYFAAFALKTDGAAVITASHNPPQYNGVKMLSGIWPLSSRQLLAVKKIFESKKFAEKPRLAYGKVHGKNVLDEYLRFAASKNSELGGLKIVVDGGNGVVGEVGVRLLRKLGAKVIPLYCEPDGRFPNHLPDPSKPENVRDLQKRVVAENADLGVAFDGDGDRAVFVDERGGVIKSDEANVLFIRDVLPKKKGGSVGFELRCSMVVREEIEKLGGKAVETNAGRIAVRESMRKGAVFACETTGHVCFADNNGFDDGIFASAKFCEILRKSGKRASQLVATVKRYHATRELRIPCARKFEAVAQAEKALKARKLRLLTSDGVKYQDEKAWGLVRASLTEPLLSARFEGKTRGDLERVYALFESAMPSFAKLPPLEQAL